MLQTLQKNKEIGIKFGILRWFRSIFNFFMFLMISDFKNAFDNYWISSLFVLFELMLYGLLIKVYDRKIFDKEEILFSIVENIKKNIQMWDSQADFMWEKYTNILFKKGIFNNYKTVFLYI